MRCRKGDLAVVTVPAGMVLRDKVNGAIVTCAERLAGEKWRVEPAVTVVSDGHYMDLDTGKKFLPGDPMYIDIFADRHLKPIRGAPIGRRAETELLTPA